MTRARSILDQLDLVHGPIGTIGRYILAVEHALRARDLHLRVTSLDEIVHVQADNSDSWRAFVPIFNPQFHGHTPTLAIVGETSTGRIVAAQAARLYDWTTTTCRAEIESMRLIYAEPERHALPDEYWTTNALVTKGIDGMVVYSGAAWYHPTVRGIGLFELIPRISRSVAHSLWQSECTISVSTKVLIDKGITARVGYSNLEWAVTARNTRMGDMDLGFLWSKTDEMLTDLTHRLAMIDSDADARQAKTTTAVSR